MTGQARAMVGESLGRYHVETTRRDHGPGVIYRATDTLVERQVVLQLAPPEAAADPERLARMRQEAAAAADFVHPGAVTCYGLEEAGGRWFVTQELVEGPNLEELTAGPPLPLEKVLEIGAALADVLAGARQAGVVHGRLRPADLLLASDGSLRVRGFGLGELRRAEAEAGPQPPPDAAYLPPEAAPGILPDHRADLYAGGRLLSDLVAAATPEGELAAPLGELLDRCLSPDPEARPRSAAELRRALEELRRDLFREQQAKAAADESVAPAAGVTGGRRWLLSAAGIVGVVAAAVAVWWLTGGGPAEEPAPSAAPAPAATGRLDLAVLPFENLGQPEDGPLAVGFSRELSRLLALEPGLTVVAPASARAAAASGVDARTAGRQLGVAHVLTGELSWQRDPELNRLEVTARLLRVADGRQLWSDSSSAFFGDAIDLQGRLAAAVAELLGAPAGRAPPGGGRGGPSLEAYLAYLEGLGRGAEATTADELRTALAALGRATLLDPEHLPAHLERARLGLALARAEPGAGHLEGAREAVARARRLDGASPAVRRAAALLAAAAGGDDAAVLAGLEAALERLPRDAGLLRAAALIDRRGGRWDQASERLTAAAGLDPWNLGLQVELVETLVRMRRFDEAGEQVERARARMPGEPEPHLLAADLLVRGRGAVEEARRLLESMPEELRSGGGYERRMLALDVYRGDFAAALERLSRAGSDGPRQLLARAWIHRYMDRPRQSAADFERVRQLLEDRLEEEPGNATLHGLIGLAYAGTGLGRQGIGRGQRATVLVPVTRDAFAGAEHVERLARIYLLAGDTEHALDELTFLLEIPSPVSVQLLRLDPVWKPLRGLPRFAELLDYYGKQPPAE